MRKFLYNFKFWFDGIFNPNVGGYKMEPVVEFIKKAYQICTFWDGHCRELLYCARENYGKLLDYSLCTIEQRTRDRKTINYYTIVARLGRIKLYKKEYLKGKKTINIFYHLIANLTRDVELDDIDYTTKVTTLYSGWGFTKNQCINALKQIRKLTPDLDWEPGMCTEHRAYSWAKIALDYLNGKKVYFMVNPEYSELSKKEQEAENEMGLRQEIYLILRDIENKDKYLNELQELMFLVLKEKTTERNKQLKKLLKQLLAKFDEEGYTSFYSLYHF